MNISPLRIDSSSRVKYGVMAILALLLASYFLIPKVSAPARAELAGEMGTVTAEATADGVLLEWKAVDDDAVITVVRDGEVVVNDLGSGSVIDDEQVSGDYADYEIEWRRDLSGGEVAEIENDAVREDAQQNPDDYEHVFLAPLSLNEFGNGTQSEDAANAVSLPDWTKFRFTTFIPSKWVDAPSVACAPLFGTYVFKGDNRTWGATESPYRTRMNVNIDWLDRGSPSATKSVGETVLYEKLSDGRYRLDSGDIASTNGMQLVVHSNSSNAANFTLKHDVTNPLCNPNLTLGIWYKYDFDVWRNGNYAISGETRKVPHQELYIRNQIDSSWDAIWRHGYLGFGCLAFTEKSDDGCYADHIVIAN